MSNSESSRKTIAVIGMGATSLYLLKNLLERADVLRAGISRVVVFERGTRAGMGMPYNPDTTDACNICNISSEELPALQQPFADWLRDRDDAALVRFGLRREIISESETYARLALGEYFEAQFHVVIDELRRHGIEVELRTGAAVTDLRDEPQQNRVRVRVDGRAEWFDCVVIATGHAFDDDDDPANGYYASPWPIHKLLPREGEFHRFAIGTLGASLSAFDVVTSLAHRHGRFEPSGGRLKFIPHAGADGFRIVMHSSKGWLPHLQYDQNRPFRAVYRHVDRAALLKLRDAQGFLRLQTYFDAVCRPVLAEAFEQDGRQDVAARLRGDDYSLEAFVGQMSAEHEYADAFDGMKREYPQSKRSVREGQPIHWKESLDDLMYTLSYHADLMPAEDHDRLRKVVMSFLMNVVAAMPLRSAEILLALHEAGRLELVPGRVAVESKRDGKTTARVEADNGTETGAGPTTHTYRMFIECAGQPPTDLDAFPFRGLVEQGAVREARARFATPAAANEAREKQPETIVETPDGPAAKLDGIDIDAAYRIVDRHGNANPRIFDIAFPHTVGLRPYCYGLQACNHTAGIVVEAWHVEADTGKSPSAGPAALTALQANVANETQVN